MNGTVNWTLWFSSIDGRVQVCSLISTLRRGIGTDLRGIGLRQGSRSRSLFRVCRCRALGLLGQVLIENGRILYHSYKTEYIPFIVSDIL